MEIFGFRKKKANDKRKDTTITQQLEELGLQANALIPLSSNKIPPTFVELNQQCEKELDIIKSKPNTAEVNKIALRFLGYGLDFVDFAKSNFGVELTFIEKDIILVEQLAEKAHEAYMSGKLSEDSLESFATMFAGYTGLLVLIHKGGEWVEETAVAGFAIKQNNGTCYFVLNKAYHRIKSGSEDSLLHFYQTISYS
jgi:hypothetical protein